MAESKSAPQSDIFEEDIQALESDLQVQPSQTFQQVLYQQQEPSRQFQYIKKLPINDYFCHPLITFLLQFTILSLHNLQSSSSLTSSIWKNPEWRFHLSRLANLNLPPLLSSSESAQQKQHLLDSKQHQFQSFSQKLKLIYSSQRFVETLQNADKIENQIFLLCSQPAADRYQKQSAKQDFLHRARRRQQNQNIVHLFQDINRILRSQDIFGLKPFWDNQLSKHLNTIFSNWDIYQNSISEELLLFTRLLQLKFFRFQNLYQIVYPGIRKVVDRLLYLLQQTSIQTRISQLIRRQEELTRRPILDLDQKIKEIYKQLEKQVECKSQAAFDFILRKFVQCEKLQKSLEKKVFFAQDKKSKEKIPLKKYIFEMPTQQEKQIRRKNLFEQASKLIRFQNLLTEQLERLEINKTRYFNNIEYQESLLPQCLNCATSFIEGFDILTDSFHQPPVFVYPLVFQVNQFKQDLLNRICALLNQGGGLILFGCQGLCRKVICRGEAMTQQQKEQVLSYFNQLLQHFYPNIAINREISVSFVPVRVNPLSIKMKENNAGPIPKIFIEGRYVTRVLVRPVVAQYTYCRIKDGQQISSILEKGQIKKLDSRNFIKTIKKKFHLYYLPINLKNQQRLFKQKPFSFYEHKCEPPQQESMIRKSQQKQREELRKIQPEKQYNSTNMLICKHSHIPRIEQLLRTMNIDCVIETDRFKKYKFKSAKYTALMHHNLTFKQLLEKIVFNQEFQCNDKQLLALAVTEYLKLENRSQSNLFSQSEYLDLQKWLQSQYPAENLRIWLYKTKQGKGEIYVRTQQRLSRAFLYYLLNDFDEKTSFKNPLGLESMNLNERQNRFQELTKKYRQDVNINLELGKRAETGLINIFQQSSPIVLKEPIFKHGWSILPSPRQQPIDQEISFLKELQPSQHKILVSQREKVPSKAKKKIVL